MKKTQENRVDRRRAEGDEDAAEDQRQDDADHQRELLQLPRHLQAAHDDDEDEQVVDRQAVLGQPAGEELARVARTGDGPDRRGRTGSPARRRRRSKMPASFIDGSCGRRPMMKMSTASIGDHHDDGDDPGVQVDVHEREALPRRVCRDSAVSEVSSASGLAEGTGCCRPGQVPSPGRSVMTMPPRGNTPLQRPVCQADPPAESPSRRPRPGRTLELPVGLDHLPQLLLQLGDLVAQPGGDLELQVGGRARASGR